MYIINLTPIEQGVYQVCGFDESGVPDGWALIPDNMVLPSTFPRLGSIKTEWSDYSYETEEYEDVEKVKTIFIKDEYGNDVAQQQTYVERELVKKEVPYQMLTVVEMTEGVLPDEIQDEFEIYSMEQMKADIDYIAIMAGVEL